MVRRPMSLTIGFVALVVLAALPALAASPPPAPGRSGEAHQDKAPEIPVTLSGTVTESTDAGGATTFTLDSGGVVYTLEAGPPWFYGDAYPLKSYVGKTVTVVGETATGSTEVDVQTVDGKVIREPGKPPWAGGWKAVGSRHPGWSQEKADRFKAKFGDCFPPGHCKAKPDATATPAP